LARNLVGDQTGAVAVPDQLARRVEQTYGERGRQWLAAAPATVAGLAERWDLRLGAAYPGATHALVLAATRGNGSPAVLKLPVVDDENYAEAEALRVYGGDGAVRLYTHCPETGALLLERAEPGSALLHHPDRDGALTVGCRLLRRLRRPAPAGVRLPTLPDVVTGWAQAWPRRQARLRVPGVDELLPVAADLAGRRAATADGPRLLVNRDAHLRNIVRARREPWLLVDPKPVIGEPAFEAGYPVLMLMGNRPTPTLAAWAVLRMAAGLAVAPDRVRDWALLQAMENALWAGKDGDNPAPAAVRALALFRTVSARQAAVLAQMDAESIRGDPVPGPARGRRRFPAES
jgi:streptomycin 6-kinase